MAELFQKTVPTINVYIKKSVLEGELPKIQLLGISNNCGG